MPSGRRANRRSRLVLRIESGRLRRSSPSIASTSKAQSVQEVRSRFQWIIWIVISCCG
jgi:hypothetical protein